LGDGEVGGKYQFSTSFFAPTTRLNIAADRLMKYSLLSGLTLGAMITASFSATPGYAQFTTFPGSTSDSCANFCIKLDVQSASTNSGLDSFGFNNSGLNNNSGGIRWQIGVAWRPNAPEVIQQEAERVKQKLDDNRSLIIALAESIANNKPELSRGIAIILAPRLNYADPKQLIAELKEGTINIGNTPVRATTNTPAINRLPVDSPGDTPPIELR
jgi:hypothetical protein